MSGCMRTRLVEEDAAGRWSTVVVAEEVAKGRRLSAPGGWSLLEWADRAGAGRRAGRGNPAAWPTTRVSRRPWIHSPRTHWPSPVVHSPRAQGHYQDAGAVGVPGSGCEKKRMKFMYSRRLPPLVSGAPSRPACTSTTFQITRGARAASGARDNQATVPRLREFLP